MFVHAFNSGKKKAIARMAFEDYRGELFGNHINLDVVLYFLVKVK